MACGAYWFTLQPKVVNRYFEGMMLTVRHGRCPVKVPGGTH
mgnify:CR=1 FL=1